MDYPRYSHHYGVGLIDDLHNYFPELLYGPVDHFPTVADVLSYIRAQVQTRFNLYTAGFRQHNPLPPAQPAQYLFPPAGPQPPTALHPLGSRGAAAPRPAPQPPVRIRTTLTSTAGSSPSHTLDLLTALLSPGLGLQEEVSFFNLLSPALGLQQPLPPLEPVIVRPTPAQIDANTTIEIVDAEEDICAICQDGMAVGSEARNLDACDHRFHVGCIDTWFQGNVHCPVCRHDVREPAAAEEDLSGNGLNISDLDG
jgi:hypothetical protein